MPNEYGGGPEVGGAGHGVRLHLRQQRDDGQERALDLVGLGHVAQPRHGPEVEARDGAGGGGLMGQAGLAAAGRPRTVQEGLVAISSKWPRKLWSGNVWAVSDSQNFEIMANSP